MAAVPRRQYKGAAVQTTIIGSLSTVSTTATIDSNTGWPSGAEPFYVVISPGTASEEKCLATISGTTLTLTRAQDDTTAQNHTAGNGIYPVFTADEADEANKFTSTMTARGDLLTMDSSVDPKRLAVGAADTVLKSDGSDPSWGTIAAANIASNAVETAKINDAAVTGPKLANFVVETKTADYTLVAGDRNKRIVMNAATGKAITVDDSVFSAGDVVWIHNINTGTCTVTAGTATVTSAGSLALAQWEGGLLYFTSAGAAIFFRGGGARTLSVEFLLVGGGGGGGGGGASAQGGGGGGAGGFVTGSGIIGQTTYTVTVGAGGAGGDVTAATRSGKNGTASSFIRSANGGGGGGGSNARIGQVGGSAGGSGSGVTTAESGISGEGNAGGQGVTDAGGGGGGAGGVGGNASTDVGGNGGAASTNSYTGSSISYSGGGGGGGDVTGGTAGTNAGNGGGQKTAGSPATANRGGGGGGGGDDEGGGNGASGRVVIRWLTADAAGLSISVTGTTTNGTDGSYTWYAWDSTGTLVVA